MTGNNVVGIIFSNMHDDKLRELTDIRTMGSVPFGGRYRTIDFALSNMVNSGITKVGVITKSNFQSLMDHLGSGKAWDLSRKHEGLFILPPFGFNNSVYQSRVEALNGIQNFLTQCKEDYVVMSDCHIVFTMDLRPVVAEHIAKNADITMVYKNSVMPADLPEKICVEVGRNRKITDVLLTEGSADKVNWGMGLYVISKKFLLKVVAEAMARNRLSFVRDILQRSFEDCRVYGYKYDGFTGVLGSMKSYFESSMELLKPAVRSDLFPLARPVYTKVRDEMPTRFGLGSKVVNSIIADGCLIEGEVENCILFRGVTVGKGAKLKNCIIMQDSTVGNNTNLNYVVADKDVVFRDGRSMMGFESYPVYISKGAEV